jgi:hypothetical protein
MTSIVMEGGTVIFRGDKVAVGQCCSCPCFAGVPDFLQPRAVVTLVLPDVSGDCPGGTYETEFDLTLEFKTAGCATIDLGGGINAQINAAVVCASNSCGKPRYFSYAQFAAYACNQIGFNCTIGNGSFVGFGPTNDEYLEHDSVIIDGLCRPLPATGSYTVLDCVLTLTMSFLLVP